MEFVIATLENPNFPFEAVASTQDEAMDLLERAWSQHFDDMRQPNSILSFDVLMETLEDPGFRYFLSTKVLAVGVAYRDGQKVAVQRVVTG